MRRQLRFWLGVVDPLPRLPNEFDAVDAELFRYPHVYPHVRGPMWAEWRDRVV